MGKDDNKQLALTATGLGATALIGVTSIFCPPLGAAFAASTTITGGTMATFGLATGNDAARDVGLTYLGAGLGGLFGGSHCNHCPKK